MCIQWCIKKQTNPSNYDMNNPDYTRRLKDVPSIVETVYQLSLHDVKPFERYYKQNTFFQRPVSRPKNFSGIQAIP